MTRLTFLFIFAFLFTNLSNACIPYYIQVQDEKGNPLSDVSILLLYKSENSSLKGVIDMMDEDEIYWKESFTPDKGWKEYFTDDEGYYEDGSPCAAVGNYPHTFVFSKSGYETVELGINKFKEVKAHKTEKGVLIIILKKSPQMEIIPTDFSTVTFKADEWVKVPVTAVTEQLTVFSTKEEGKIWLFDANGRLHLQQNLQNQTDLNINNLAAGHYYLRVQSGEDQKTIKVLKL